MSGTTGFLEGATGQPSNQVIQLTTHDCLDIDDFNTLRDSRLFEAQIGVTKGTVDPQKTQSGGVPPEQLMGKAVIEGFEYQTGDVDPADRATAILLSNMFGYHKITDNTTWRLMQFSNTGLTSPTTADTYLKGIFDTDVLPRMRVLNMRAGGLTVDGTGDNLTLSFPCNATRFDLWGTPTQGVGSGSTLPTLLVDYHEAWDSTFTDDLEIQVVSFTSGVATCKMKWESDASFGATTFTVDTTSAKPTRVVNSDGSGAVQASRNGLSSFAAPVEIAWPPSPTLVAADEFSIPIRRAAPSTSLPAARNIPLVNVQLYRNDIQLDAEGGFQLTANWSRFEALPFKTKEQGGKVIKTGILTPQLDLTRELADLVMQEKLFNRSAEPLVIEGQTDAQISGASRPYKFRCVLPSMSYSGTGYVVTGGGESTEESVILRGGQASSAYTYESRSYTSPLTVELETDNSAIP